MPACLPMLSMPIKKVLIVAKKSAYQTYFNEYQERPLRKLALKGDKALLHIRRSHNTHYQTLSFVKDVLKKRRIAARVFFRGESFNPKKYDLVISVGGDGSFLEASHRLDDQMILGVNSDQNHSVGKLCIANRANFEKCFDKILSGHFYIQKLNRLKIYFNGAPLKFFVLNDILISHICPAAMSHYVLKIGKTVERQRSSGVWVSTAAGSSAAIHSAGGRPMKQASAQLQYFPRELFEGHGQRYHLTGGVLPEGQSLSIVSQMQEGMLYLDGAHHSKSFDYGDEIKVSNGLPLKAVRFTPQ